MEFPTLFPGQEYLSRKKKENGREEVVYAYRSERGTFFSCTGRTEEEVRDKCMGWLIRQERH